MDESQANTEKTSPPLQDHPTMPDGKKPGAPPDTKPILPPHLRQIARYAFSLGAVEMFAGFDTALVFSSERTSIEGDLGAWIIIRFAVAPGFTRGAMYPLRPPPPLQKELDEFITNYLSIKPDANYFELYAACITQMPEASVSSHKITEAIYKQLPPNLKIHLPPNQP